jgi:DnaJ-class molecular chaperone
VPAPTHYQTLGVEPSATAGQIRQAYRAKAKSLHPDVCKAADAASKFAQLAVAYEVLSDRKRRAEYDESLITPKKARRGKGAETATAHYTWSNIATEQVGAESGYSDFDEMYDAYFKPHKPAE